MEADTVRKVLEERLGGILRAEIETQLMTLELAGTETQTE
jgi:hypothetical protein